MTPGSQSFRLSAGGLIDRARPLSFSFDGKVYHGYAGDCLASALLANGVRLVGRSFKYHRPRGVFAAGAEEPNALVRLGRGDRREPNLRATQVPLTDGLEAWPQNCWPSVDVDLGRAVGLISALLPSGFYYKTFMWPAAWWRGYEHLLRRAAGLGRAPQGADPDRYDTRHAHCDLLVVGGGPAGLAAAQTAARGGARVILCEQDSRLGGSLLWDGAVFEGGPALDWVRSVESELEGLETAAVLKNACAFGCYDGNLVLAAEQLGQVAPLRQRLWKIRARRIVLASGAIERPLVFAGNDKPGVMLASAVRSYLARHAVATGRRAAVFTNNDSGAGAALDLAAAGIEVVAVVDCRAAPKSAAAEALRDRGIPLLAGHAVVQAGGARTLAWIDVAPLEELDAARGRRRLACDCLALSGGWSPAVHLYSQRRGALHFDAQLAAFFPGGEVAGMSVAGAAAGRFDLADCLADGAQAGRSDGRQVEPPRVRSQGPVMTDIRPVWAVGGGGRPRDKRFIDLQNDVTAEDLALAFREGYRSVEHVKRYTTTGMGTDQGKTSNVNAIGLLAEMTGAQPGEVGVTTFRPPYVPVTFGALAGRRTGGRLEPCRRTPFHGCSAAAGAVFVASGPWLYPRYYPKPGETMAAAVRREALNVRRRVGIVDMSTLGKLELQGRDAAAFLERVYANTVSSLPVSRARYGVMLREDGMLLDDGTVSRLGESHFLVTATTANIERVTLYLEKLLQVHWPELEVHLVPVTEQWASLAVAGPRARDVLRALAPEFSVEDEDFPFLAVREGRVANLPARVFRISFSGELGYEINVPAGDAPALWQAAARAGDPFGLAPYGLEALDLLRIEKGHLSVGTEIDGRTTADDLGLGRLVSRKKACVGQALLDRPALAGPGRLQLVGLSASDRRTPIPAAAQLVADGASANHNGVVPSLGHVTAAVFSPALNRPIALALLRDGRARLGETLVALSPLTGERVPVTVAEPVFYDPEGARLRG